MTWHVATVSSRKEASAVHDMQAIGIDAYFPQKVRWKQLQLRKVPVKSPIIPGYVFFRLNDPEEQQYVDTCDGVTGVLTCGFTAEGDRKLARIPSAWVEGIRAEELAGEFDSTIDRTVKAKPGDRVRIIIGDFAEQIATIQREHNKGEWTVEVEGAGSFWARTTISKDGVRPLEEAA